MSSVQDRYKARFAVDGNVVVSGGVESRGLSVARALLEHGASGCCIWDSEDNIRNAQRAIISLAQDFPKLRVFAMSVDIAIQVEIEEAISAVVQTLGSLDHLVLFRPKLADVYEIDDASGKWQKIPSGVADISLCTQAVVKQMRLQNGAGYSITIVSSTADHQTTDIGIRSEDDMSKGSEDAEATNRGIGGGRKCIRINQIVVPSVTRDAKIDSQNPSADKSSLPEMQEAGELDGICVLLASRAGRHVYDNDFVVGGGSYEYATGSDKGQHL